jgi:hypothetical protein
MEKRKMFTENHTIKAAGKLPGDYKPPFSDYAGGENRVEVDFERLKEIEEFPNYDLVFP